MGEFFSHDGLEIHMNNWLAIPVCKMQQHQEISWAREPEKKETKKKPHVALYLEMTFEV